MRKQRKTTIFSSFNFVFFPSHHEGTLTNIPSLSSSMETLGDSAEVPILTVSNDIYRYLYSIVKH